MKYNFGCSSGHTFTVVRSIDERDAPITCPLNPAGLPATRLYASEFASQYLPPRLDRNQFILWSDVFDRSPREMAHDPDVVRYDPSLPHKPIYAPPGDGELAGVLNSVPRRAVDDQRDYDPRPATALPEQWKP